MSNDEPTMECHAVGRDMIRTCPAREIPSRIREALQNRDAIIEADAHRWKWPNSDLAGGPTLSNASRGGRVESAARLTRSQASLQGLMLSSPKTPAHCVGAWDKRWYFGNLELWKDTMEIDEDSCRIVDCRVRIFGIA